MSIRGILHLVVVYIVWGSTYLAIRVAVREGSGFPPFTMAGMRVLVASVILFSWAAAAKRGIRVGRRELGVLLASGILMWVGGNGLVSWAEQSAESAYSALLIGSMPIWVTIMESLIDRRPPTLRLLGALLIGLAGVGVLNGPVILAGSHQDFFAAVALVCAAITWGLARSAMGLQRKRATPPAKMTTSRIRRSPSRRRPLPASSFLPRPSAICPGVSVLASIRASSNRWLAIPVPWSRATAIGS